MQLICATSCAWHAKCTCSCSKDAAAPTVESKNRRPSLETERERNIKGEGESKRQAGSVTSNLSAQVTHTRHTPPRPPLAHIHIRLKLPPGLTVPTAPAAGRAVAVAPIPPLQNTRRTRHKFCTLFCGAAQHFSAFASQQHTHTRTHTVRERERKRESKT